ncbi:MAG TPA: hypothetical protein VM689_14965 [Aliidongia sp.]|nr:hypothetical protein [Aliidongia sp.]
MATKAGKTKKEDRAGIIEALGHAGPYGVLGLFSLVLEAALLAWFVQAGGPAERITAGVLMVIVLIVLVGAVLFIERLRRLASTPALAQAAATLDSQGLSPAEIESKPKLVADTAAKKAAAPGEIIAAPDGSYVIARPGAGWTVRQATVESRLQEKFGVKDVSGLPQLPIGSMIMLQFGDGFVYEPRPDRTRVNGRRIPLLLSEPLQRTVQITTIPRRSPPFFIERSLYDNFFMLAAADVVGQLVSIRSLTPGKLPKTNRDLLAVELVQELEDLIVSGREVETLRIQIRGIAIRGDLFDYIISATNFRMSGEPEAIADRMDEDVSALLDSFRTLSPPDPEAAERDQIRQAEAQFDASFATVGSALFHFQINIAAARLRELDYGTIEGMARAMTILRPFRVLAGMLKDPTLGMDAVWAAMDAADRGDSAPLRQLLDQLKVTPETAPATQQLQPAASG